jgi:uncharacterized OB-fold protein
MPVDARHPVADGDSAPFWEAAKQGRLRLQQCAQCNAVIYYPRALCPHCHGTDLAWRDLSGLGRIYSFTVSRRAASAEFEARVPYVVALVDLDEGARMLSGIRTADVADVRCGQRVHVAFEDVGDGVVLPMFEVA